MLAGEETAAKSVRQWHRGIFVHEPRFWLVHERFDWLFRDRSSVLQRDLSVSVYIVLRGCDNVCRF